MRVATSSYNPRVLRTMLIATSLAACGCSLIVGSLEEDNRAPAQDGGEQPDAGAPDAPLTPDRVPAYSLRVNLAGSEHEGTDYPGTWLADDGSYCGGLVWTTTAAIHNTVDDPLFQANRYGLYTCDFGAGQLENGDYIVTLLFGEGYRGEGCESPSQLSRSFDVLIEGVRVLTDFDIMAANGGCVASTLSTLPAPVSRQFTATVTDGNLTIETQGATNGVINAVEVVSVATVEVGSQ